MKFLFEHVPPTLSPADDALGCDDNARHKGHHNVGVVTCRGIPRTGDANGSKLTDVGAAGDGDGAANGSKLTGAGAGAGAGAPTSVTSSYMYRVAPTPPVVTVRSLPAVACRMHASHSISQTSKTLTQGP